MREILALCALVLLAACGADGAPEPPPTKPGLAVTGEVSAGIVTSDES
jgi:hypothetical protein